MYAIETFPTIGKGLNIKTNKCNHFMINKYDLSIDETVSEVGTLSLLLGFLSSVVTSYFSINLLLSLIQKQQFHYFTPYCLLLGFVLIYTSLF